jgi:short-subunit dehydrogenase
MSSSSIKRVVIVTGASRGSFLICICTVNFLLLISFLQGIGAQIAIDLNTRFSSDTLFILIARDISKLESIKEDFLQKRYETNRYYTLKIDFSVNSIGTDEYKVELENILKNESLVNLTELFVFYNHGTLELLPVEEAAKISADFYQINVISVWKFLAAIRALFPICEGLKQFQINISSKMATMTLPSYSLYTSSL